MSSGLWRDEESGGSGGLATGGARLARWVTVSVFVVAAVARVWPVVHGAGLGADYNYDGPVYYAASDSLLHGRVPYRQFVLLHPPGLMLVLLPFTWLGSLVGDHVGFIAANLAFTVLGAVNAALVVVIGRRAGVSWRGAGMGGLFYALFVNAVSAEYLVRLEPLGNFFTLAAVYAVVRGRDVSRQVGGGRSRGGGWLLVAGGCIGAAAGTKIWWFVPLAVIVLWPSAGARWGRAVVLKAVGAAAALSVICLPFAGLAPRQMFAMVVTDQLGRPPRGISEDARLRQLTGARSLSWLLPTVTEQTVVVLAVIGLFLFGCVGACRLWLGRLATVLAAAILVVLLAAPSWYAYYADFVTPAAALIVSTGPTGLRKRPRPRRKPAPARADDTLYPRPAALAPGRGQASAGTGRTVVSGVVAVASVAAAVLALVPVKGPYPLPLRRLDAAVRAARCVSSDSPMILIATNTLTSDLRRGCTTWVDTTGALYGPDAPHRLPDGQLQSRTNNTRWQHALLTYLSSGGANVVSRPETGLSVRTRNTLRDHGVLMHADGITVYSAPNPHTQHQRP